MRVVYMHSFRILNFAIEIWLNANRPTRGYLLVSGEKRMLREDFGVGFVFGTVMCLCHKSSIMDVANAVLVAF